MNEHPGCFLFFGKFGDTCKLIGLLILAIISTILVWITPFYFLTLKLYKEIKLLYGKIKKT